jgi:hypothetical protein
MWSGKKPKRRRRDATLSPHDEQRIAEIRRSFAERGWRLAVNEDYSGAWVAWFFQEELGPTTNDVVRRRTALEAALAAWDTFKSKPRLSSSRLKSRKSPDEADG